MTNVSLKRHPLTAGFTTAVVAALALAALVGCDGGGDDSAPESSPAGEGDASAPSRARYIATADAICRDALRETRRLRAGFGEGIQRSNTPDPLVLTTKFLVEPALKIRERQRERLLRLERPVQQDEDLDVFLDLFGPIEELIRQRLSVGREGDFEQARELELLAAGELVEQGQAARRFGFRDCAEDFMGALFPMGSPG